MCLILQLLILRCTGHVEMKISRRLLEMLRVMKSLMKRALRQNSRAEDSHKVAYTGGAGGESRARIEAGIDQTGRRRATFCRDKREVSMRLELAVPNTTEKEWRIDTEMWSLRKEG